MITQEECQALQKAGAESRAAGRTELDNPYYRKENMPPATGDTFELWALKEECWRLGWKIENMIRSK